MPPVLNRAPRSEDVWRMALSLHAFLTLALDGSGCLASRLKQLNHGEGSPALTGYVTCFLRFDPDAVVKINIFLISRLSSFNVGTVVTELSRLTLISLKGKATPLQA
jgi:hypothetical protein